MVIPVKTRDGGYDIVMERGALARIGELIGESSAGRLSLVVTDDGVPAQYAETVAAACRAGGRAEILTIPQGEEHKTMESLTMILGKLVELRATRKDRVIAVGGGVVGDMTGLADGAVPGGFLGGRQDRHRFRGSEERGGCILPAGEGGDRPRHAGDASEAPGGERSGGGFEDVAYQR